MKITIFIIVFIILLAGVIFVVLAALFEIHFFRFAELLSPISEINLTQRNTRLSQQKEDIKQFRI